MNLCLQDYLDKVLGVQETGSEESVTESWNEGLERSSAKHANEAIKNVACEVLQDGALNLNRYSREKMMGRQVVEVCGEINKQLQAVFVSICLIIN